MIKNLICITIFSTLFLISCKKDNTTTLIKSQTFEINATNSAKWKYFSFARKDTITITDPLNSNEWDLAFQRYRVRTNGGLSGNGSGSAANSYLKEQSGFDALKVVSDTASFSLDASVSIPVQVGYATYILNPELYTWFTIELTTGATQIVPNDYIYVVRTGDGKYAKVWFKSYYSPANVSGYVTIQYKYQPDGSKILE
jgi:hypothetical protein